MSPALPWTSLDRGMSALRAAAEAEVESLHRDRRTQPTAPPHAGCELLESRRFFAVSVSMFGGILNVTGDSDNDRIILRGSGGDVEVFDALNDFSWYYNDVEQVNVTGGSGTDLIDCAGLSGVEQDLWGSFDNDTIYGGTGPEIHLLGDDGNDHIYGASNNDTIHGGDGHDYCYGGGGDDMIRGGDGNDTIYGGAGQDYMYGEGDSDEIHGDDDGSDVDFMRGGPPADDDDMRPGPDDNSEEDQ